MRALRHRLFMGRPAVRSVQVWGSLPHLFLWAACILSLISNEYFKTAIFFADKYYDRDYSGEGIRDVSKR